MTENSEINVRMTDVKDFFEDVVCLRFFKKVIKVNYTPGQGKLVLITGENASGKSFLRRVVHSAFKKNDLELIALSMEFRTESLMTRLFVYGNECRSATSCNTVNSILGAIRTSRGREEKHAIFWDEPDTGLSDNFAAGAADEILEFLSDPPENLLFASVVTHRKVMLERLAASNPHHLRIGDDKMLSEVLSAKLEPRRLSELEKKNYELKTKILKEFKI